MTEIKFVKESHEYLANTGDGVWVPYTSVTTIVGRYSPPFPKELIASKVAEANSRKGELPDTIEDVIDSWDRNGEVACDYGNAVHGAVENYIKHGAKPKAKYLLDIVNSFIDLGLGKCVSEQIIFHDEYQVSGTMDILEQVDGKKVRLLDIKTNGDLTTAKGKLLAPFNNMKNTKFNVYTLQLSTYAYLLRCRGYEVEKAQILHVVDKDITVMDVPLDLVSDSEIEQMLREKGTNK